MRDVIIATKATETTTTTTSLTQFVARHFLFKELLCACVCGISMLANARIFCFAYFYALCFWLRISNVVQSTYCCGIWQFQFVAMRAIRISCLCSFLVTFSGLKRQQIIRFHLYKTLMTYLCIIDGLRVYKERERYATYAVEFLSN